MATFLISYPPVSLVKTTSTVVIAVSSRWHNDTKACMYIEQMYFKEMFHRRNAHHELNKILGFAAVFEMFSLVWFKCFYNIQEKVFQLEDHVVPPTWSSVRYHVIITGSSIYHLATSVNRTFVFPLKLLHRLNAGFENLNKIDRATKMPIKTVFTQDWNSVLYKYLKI